MYARNLRVELVADGERRPCPLEWLDAFAMRNFTGSAEFDDTLPVADGHMEAGFRVNPERLEQALAEWLNQRGKGEGKAIRVEIRVLESSGDAVQGAQRDPDGGRVQGG